MASSVTPLGTRYRETLQFMRLKTKRRKCVCDEGEKSERLCKTAAGRVKMNKIAYCLSLINGGFLQRR
jgi:hypothetical protein